MKEVFFRFCTQRYDLRRTVRDDQQLILRTVRKNGNVKTFLGYTFACHEFDNHFLTSLTVLLSFQHNKIGLESPGFKLNEWNERQPIFGLLFKRESTAEISVFTLNTFFIIA